MMSDKLKQFIDENRKSFDTAEPDPRLFKKLQLGLSGSGRIKRMSSPLLKWVAAAAMLILVAGIAYFTWPGKNDTAGDIAKEIPDFNNETNGISDPVYAKQIYHFKNLIGLKQSELKQLEKVYPQLYRQFAGDINQLDSSYQSLKITLAENPNREMLLEAMIQNLQLQSDLLNRQLLIIKEIKQKSKNHEKNI